MSQGWNRVFSRHDRRHRCLGILCGLLMLSACGKGGGAGDTGTISFSITPPGTSKATLAQAALFPCAGRGIAAVTAEVRDSQGALVASAGPWDCLSGQGDVTDVPVGEDYTLIILMTDASGHIVYRGTHYPIRVIAGATTDAGTISMEWANQAPILTVPAGVQHVAPTGQLQFPVSATDPEGDALTFDIANLPYNASGNAYWPGVSFVPDPQNPNQRIFTWTTHAVPVSEHKVLFRVSDNGTPRRSTYAYVTIQVYTSCPGEVSGYYLPTLDPITLPSRIAVHDLVAFTVTASGPDDYTASLSAESPPGKSSFIPSGYTFNTTTRQFSWTPSATGNYWIRFVATRYINTYELKDYEDVLITVGDINRPPKLDLLGMRKVQCNTPLQFVVTARDPELHSITFDANYIPAAGGPAPVSDIGASFDPATQVFSWTPSESLVGQTRTIRFRATDNGLPYTGDPPASDMQDVDIRVVNE